MPAATKKAYTAARKFAMKLPEAWEDFPWGERVVKVGKKVFVFLGRDTSDHFGMSVKLPVSGKELLGETFAEPTGYGLGKGGWVTVKFQAEDAIPVGLICDWIEESYRAVAPKKLSSKIGGETQRS